MKLTCYIVDDEKAGINILRDYIEKDGSLAITGWATDPLEAIATFKRDGPPDVLFLDIDMPEMSGLTFADLFPQCHVIFCTSFREYAADAFDKDAMDYLLKPISFERFVKAIQKLRDLPVRQERSFLVHAGSRGNLAKVDPETISYIKGMLNYIEIYQSADKLITHMSMEEVLQKLPRNFSRVHRSYIVNHHFIQKILTGKLQLLDGSEIPTGKVFRKRFLEKVQLK